MKYTDTAACRCQPGSVRGCLWPATGRLLVADAEVEKVPSFAGKKHLSSELDGTLLNSYSVFFFTNEPTGISVNRTNNHIFIHDDVKRKVFEVNLGPRSKSLGPAMTSNLL